MPGHSRTHGLHAWQGMHMPFYYLICFLLYKFLHVYAEMSLDVYAACQ